MRAKPLLTLDNNLIVALEKYIKGEANERETENALAIEELVAFHKEGHITIQTTFCAVLEASPNGKRPRELNEFMSDMVAIGLGDVLHLQHPAFLGFREGNAIVYDTYRERAYQQMLHTALFPNIDLSLTDYRRRYCQQSQLDADLLADILTYQEHSDNAFPYDPQRLERLARAKEACADNPELLSHEQEIQKKWQNALNDSYGLYIHISHGGSIFVTDDSDFYKESRRRVLSRLVPGKILRPQVAAREVQGCSSST